MKSTNYYNAGQNNNDDNHGNNTDKISNTEEYGLFPTINDDIKINEICLRCQSNEEDWRKRLFNYKLSEIILYMIGLVITLASLAVSVWFYFFSADFKAILFYLHKLNQIFGIHEFALHMTLVYFVIECIALFIDLAQFFVILKIFLVFAKNLRKVDTQRRTKQQTDGDDSAGDFLVEYASQDNRKLETIQNLKQRIQTRVELRFLLANFVWLQILISAYLFVIVIAPKVLGSVYIEFFLVPKLNTQTFSNRTLHELIDLSANLTESSFGFVNQAWVMQKLNLTIFPLHMQLH